MYIKNLTYTTLKLFITKKKLKTNLNLKTKWETNKKKHFYIMWTQMKFVLFFLLDFRRKKNEKKTFKNTSGII